MLYDGSFGWNAWQSLCAYDDFASPPYNVGHHLSLTGAAIEFKSGSTSEI